MMQQTRFAMLNVDPPPLPAGHILVDPYVPPPKPPPPDAAVEPQLGHHSHARYVGGATPRERGVGGATPREKRGVGGATPREGRRGAVGGATPREGIGRATPREGVGRATPRDGVGRSTPRYGSPGLGGMPRSKSAAQYDLLSVNPLGAVGGVGKGTPREVWGSAVARATPREGKVGRSTPREGAPLPRYGF